MVMKTPAFWQRQGLTSTALLPLASLYKVGASIHQWRSTAQSAALPLVCLGNLTVGGTGKTPLCLALAKTLTARGLRPLILSKGYGGLIYEPTLVDRQYHKSIHVGDEPLMMAQDHEVLISRSRSKALEKIAELKDDFDIVLMDDGMQNPNVLPDLRLAVLDDGFGFGNSRIFPAGPLRQPLEAGLSKIDALIVVKTGEEASHETLSGLQDDLKRFDVQTHVEPSGDGAEVLAFCGIGRPAKFFKSLEYAGYAVRDSHAYGDHHPYGEQELEALERRADQQGLRMVTTRKDWVRLDAEWKQKVQAIDLKISWPEQELTDFILTSLGLQTDPL